MKNQFNPAAAAFDAQAINRTIQSALASAGLDTSSGPMRDVAETIRRALDSGSLGEVMPLVRPTESVIDITARVIDRQEAPEADSRPALDEAETPRTFERREYSNRAGTRSYKLYVPESSPVHPLPMVVMLHGCTQSADDFAAGTQMNRLADAHGFLVVYPEQSAAANVSKCWNWFQAQHQVRDSGEPSLIAGIVKDVAARHDVDEHRIFVAGLSAGAAMAVVLGETYPELFAGVGVHSGLPYASASDIPSAMAAMKGGRSRSAAMKGLRTDAAQARKKVAHAVPTIVFHGDRDHTVQQSNGIEVVKQANDAHQMHSSTDLLASTQRARSPGGRNYTRTVYADGQGQPRLESWSLHGAGHAWSGGNGSGSYTDASGPDASKEMARFFLALRPAAR